MNYHISTIFHLITKEARRFDPSNPADILLLLFYTLDRTFAWLVLIAPLLDKTRKDMRIPFGDD